MKKDVYVRFIYWKPPLYGKIIRKYRKKDYSIFYYNIKVFNIDRTLFDNIFTAVSEWEFERMTEDEYKIAIL